MIVTGRFVLAHAWGEEPCEASGGETAHDGREPDIR